MRRAFLSLAVLWLVVVAAGCVENARPPAEGPPPEARSFDRTFLQPTWNECDVLITGANYPSPLVDVREDPEWSPAGDGSTHVRLHGLDCQEVVWGTFRGPLRMLFEWGDEALPPEACLAEGESGTLQSLWVSDAGLAGALASSFEGLPVHAAEIEVAAEPFSYRWEWGLEGSEQSWVAVSVESPPEDGPLEGSLRVYWFNETGVSFLDIEDNRFRALNPSVTVSWGNRLATGHLSSPMVGSSMGEYVALGERGRTAGILEGQVSRFGDHFCTNEIP